MPRKPCLIPGCHALALQGSSRCPTHRIPAYPHAERERMRAAVEEHRRTRGEWCPGYRVPGHLTTDLTADHVVARARGGMGSALSVLCRQCNARKRDGNRA